MRTFDKDELRRRVSEVLFYFRDPIGVSPEPCARSEYDSHVASVLELVNAKHLAETATLLLEHKAAVEQGLA